jgi:hypothetical protein
MTSEADLSFDREPDPHLDAGAAPASPRHEVQLTVKPVAGIYMLLFSDFTFFLTRLSPASCGNDVSAGSLWR